MNRLSIQGYNFSLLCIRCVSYWADKAEEKFNSSGAFGWTVYFYSPVYGRDVNLIKNSGLHNKCNSFVYNPLTINFDF